MPQADAPTSSAPLALRSELVLPFVVLWNAPLILLVWFPWAVVSITVGVVSLLVAVFIVVGWYCKVLRRMCFRVSDEVPEHPPLVWVISIGMLMTGLLCFALR